MCLCVWGGGGGWGGLVRMLKLTKRGFTPSLQADAFGIRLNKKVLHTHVFCYNDVWDRESRQVLSGVRWEVRWEVRLVR